MVIQRTIVEVMLVVVSLISFINARLSYSGPGPTSTVLTCVKDLPCRVSVAYNESLMIGFRLAVNIQTTGGRLTLVRKMTLCPR